MIKSNHGTLQKATEKKKEASLLLQANRLTDAATLRAE
jgi:hypothetical protein